MELPRRDLVNLDGLKIARLIGKKYEDEIENK